MILATAVLVQSLMSFAIFAPLVMAPVVLAALGLPGTAAGLYAPFAYSCAIVSSLGSGWLLTKAGPWKVSLGCLVLSGIGLAVFGSGSAPALALGAMLIGLSYGPLTAAGSTILVQSNAANLGLRMSVRQSGVPLGWSAAGFLLPPLIALVGWQFACLAMALGAVVVAALLAVACPFVRGEKPLPRRPAKEGERGFMRLTLASPGLRSTAVITFAFSSLQNCYASFASIYLVSVIGLDLVTAGSIIGIGYGLGIAARILWGAVADRLGILAVLVGLGVAMSLASILTGMLVEGLPLPFVFATISLFTVTGSGWNGIAMARMASFVAPERTGAAAGEMAVFAYIGFIFAPPTFSLVSQFANMHVAFVIGGLACGLATAAVLVGARRARGASS